MKKPCRIAAKKEAITCCGLSTVRHAIANVRKHVRAFGYGCQINGNILSNSTVKELAS